MLIFLISQRPGSVIGELTFYISATRIYAHSSTFQRNKEQRLV